MKHPLFVESDEGRTVNYVGFSIYVPESVGDTAEAWLRQEDVGVRESSKRSMGQARPERLFQLLVGARETWLVHPVPRVVALADRLGAVLCLPVVCIGE